MTRMHHAKLQTLDAMRMSECVYGVRVGHSYYVSKKNSYYVCFAQSQALVPMITFARGHGQSHQRY